MQTDTSSQTGPGNRGCTRGCFHLRAPVNWMMGNEEGQGPILSPIPLFIVPNAPTAPQNLNSWHRGKLSTVAPGQTNGRANTPTHGSHGNQRPNCGCSEVNHRGVLQNNYQLFIQAVPTGPAGVCRVTPTCPHSHPSRQRRSHNMADGSVVWLNGCSFM